MIRRATAADLLGIRELLQSANDMPYDIGRVAEEKCFGAGFEGPPEARIRGNFDGISVTCGKYLRLLAVRPDARRSGIGTELLREAESRGARIIAAEPGNYFTPGVPESMAPFFTARGFRETARTNNLVAELPGLEGPGDADVIAAAPGDRQRALDFVGREFGPIWKFETARAATIFRVEHDGDIAGFSTHEANNRGLGFFGPAGVAKEVRGRGFGRRLLMASLMDLRRLGYDRAVIPWTDAIDFYRKSCQARVAHRFVILRKSGA